MQFHSLHQMTPLHVAAEVARYQVVDYLIDQKADIEGKAKNGVNT